MLDATIQLVASAVTLVEEMEGGRVKQLKRKGKR